MNKKIAIVYWSGTGNTEAMANLVAEGAQAAGVQPDVFTAADFNAEKAADYSAIGFGCPSMGTEQLEEFDFEPMFESVKGVLGGKGIVLFGSYGWGDGEWMRNWQSDCEDCGCSLLAEPVIVNGGPDGASAEDCKKLGEALAAG